MSRRIVASFVLAGAIFGTAVAASGAPSNPQLRFPRFLGNELPNNGSMAEVIVSCAGAPGSSCNGELRLLPRGADTQRLVGSGPIAIRSIRNAPAGDERAVILGLDKRSREAMARRNVLQLTIELRETGRGSVTRNVVAAKERAIVGHRRPDSVVRHVGLRRFGGRSATAAAAATTVEYSWSWTIPVRTFLVLPDFRCPSSEPYVAGSSRTLTYLPRRGPPGGPLHTWARVGKLTAVAKAGTGYAAFTKPHLTNHGGVRMMTGWPKGNWTENNAWAPLLFNDGKFELKVTCTSSDALDDVAWIGEDVSKKSGTTTFRPAGVFPWATDTRPVQS